MPGKTIPIANEDEALLRLLLEKEGIELSPLSAIIKHVDGQEPSPSFAQQRLLFLHRIDPQSEVYNIPLAFRLAGKVDITALEESINEIVRRHEVLRTRFETVHDATWLRVAPDLRVELPVIDLSDTPGDGQGRALERQIVEQSRLPFDLERGQLLRMRLFRLQEDEHAALLTMHHIVADGWSIMVFVRELCELYSAFSAGLSSPLPELSIQYSDFSRWQKERFEQGVFAAQLGYWEKQLEGAARLELPTDFPRPPVQTFNGAAYGFRLPATVGERLEKLTRDEHATLFMVLLAALNVVLHRYTQQTDIVVGTPIANRNRRELEPLIGFFVNTLVLRTDCSGQPTFRALLRRVRDTALAAYQHQDLPFEQLVSKLMRGRDASGNPLFQVMFSLENAPQHPLALPDLTITPLPVPSRIAKFDLLVNMAETETQLVGGIEYNTDLFKESTIARLAGHFTNVVEAVASDPDRPISSLSLLSPNELHQALVQWNATSSCYPRGCDIPQHFESQVARSLEAIAVEFCGHQLTYAELNVRANQLSHYLRTLGVGPETLVAVFVERSIEMVLGFLGILKAGGAYVPLDITYPRQRLAFMLDDCQVPVLLTQRHLRPRLPVQDTKVVCLDSDWELIARESADNPGERFSDDQIAYIIYTSGSTGVPKGVAVPHRAVNRLVLESNYIQLDPSDKVAQASNVAFDAATFEIWGALLNGARLVGIGGDVTLSPQQFAMCLHQQGITTLFLTTALFNQVARDEPTAFQSLRHLLFGGEAVDPQWVRQVLQHGPPQRLLHVYGPTENTTFSTWYLVREVPEGATRVPIGGPISATQVYVLDRHLQPAPVGVTGELHLGGEGLARGYLHRPELTAEKFVPDPFCQGGGGRLYKTGDLVRYLPDGNIEFLDRLDDQIKIRGFRVELGEIEAVLSQHSAIREAVLMVRGDESHRRQLVAYVVAKGDRSLDPGELREFLRAKLPHYMIPAHFLQLERLPLTPNGKIDKSAFPSRRRCSRRQRAAIRLLATSGNNSWSMPTRPSSGVSTSASMRTTSNSAVIPSPPSRS